MNYIEGFGQTMCVIPLHFKKLGKSLQSSLVRQSVPDPQEAK